MNIKRWLYRLLMFGLAATALVCGYAAEMGYAINKFYFPNQPHPRSDLFGPYALYAVAALFLIESVFLIVLRRFTAPPNKALQRTQTGGGADSDFQP